LAPIGGNVVLSYEALAKWLAEHGNTNIVVSPVVDNPTSVSTIMITGTVANSTLLHAITIFNDSPVVREYVLQINEEGSGWEDLLTVSVVPRKSHTLTGIVELEPGDQFRMGISPHAEATGTSVAIAEYFVTLTR